MRFGALGPAAWGMAAFALLGSVCGQGVDRFEVASIKPNLSGAQNTSIATEGGRLVITNATLKTLIRNAYGILDFQLTGGPGWLDTAMFDIQAKTGQAKTGAPENITPVLFKRLLQNLLEDRFQLKVRWDTREMPVYALLLDKNGPKFKADTSSAEPGMNTSRGAGKVKMTGTNVPIADFASNLGFQLKRIVLDQTGLTAQYDFALEFAADQAAETTDPSLFTAVRDQLGLKLESRKGPVQMLVIERAEKPSEN